MPFPIYPTSELSMVARQRENVIDIDFKAKGAFLAHPDISASHIPGILRLFGSIVAFDLSRKTSWSDKILSLRDILSTIFFTYAANCRVDSGYRLLQLFIRHATDSRFPRIDKENAKLINHKGELGIHLPRRIIVRVYPR